jgi:hypothetical protein
VKRNQEKKTRLKIKYPHKSVNIFFFLILRALDRGKSERALGCKPSEGLPPT